MRFRAVGLSLAVALLAACGGDSTGPSEPQNASVGGAWSFALSNLSGGGVSCNIAPLPLAINQSGSTFSGTFGPSTVSCTGPGGTSSGSLPGGSVVNGTVVGTNVSFDFDTQDAHHTGTVSGSSMSGQAVYRFDFGAPTGVVTLTGNWSAAKK